MYADYDFYKNTYGGTAITAENTYNRYAGKASSFMDFITRGRLSGNLPSNETDLEKIEMCCAVLADLYCEIETTKESISSSAGGGVVKSLSSGGESVSYELTAFQEAVAAGGSELRKYLADEAKIYLAGVADDEGEYYYYWGI